MKKAKVQMREVSCLFATRNDQVLLESKDRGQHWHFPQEEIHRDESGNSTETPIDAVYRIVGKIDGLEEEDVVSEGSRPYFSHKGVYTEYPIFTTESKLEDVELKHDGSILEWTNGPHSKNLNECTRDKLKKYCF